MSKPARPARSTTFGFGCRMLKLPSVHSKLAWIVLALTLCLTWLAWSVSNRAIERRLQDKADFVANNIANAISKRIDEQKRILRAGVGLFDASANVSRGDFRKFVTKLNIRENYPGLLGYGYAKVIRPEELLTHVKNVKAEGFSRYQIKPKGIRNPYTSIIYLEPFDWRNRRAFGYDMFSEPTRRAAMEQARDSGEPSMTKAVTLVQETGQDVQKGFLIYLPVYKAGGTPTTKMERRDLIEGFVYSPFRMNDFMGGILGAAHANSGLKIFDHPSKSSDRLLYTNHLGVGADTSEKSASHVQTRHLRFGDTTWSLEITPHPEAHGFPVNSEPVLIATGGIAIDFLIFFLISAISRQSARAKKLADEMTQDLRDETRRAKRILNNIGDGIVTTDADGYIRMINPACCELFGYSNGRGRACQLPVGGHNATLRLLRRQGVQTGIRVRC